MWIIPEGKVDAKLKKRFLEEQFERGLLLVKFQNAVTLHKVCHYYLNFY